MAAAVKSARATPGAPAGVEDIKPLFVPPGSSRSPTWIETKLWSFLQWYTSFFYWGTGVALGLLQGYVYLITTYSAQLLVDTMDLFRLRTPPYLEKVAAGRIGVQPSPDLHHSALTQKAKTKLQRALDKEDETVPRACPRPQTTPKKPTGAKAPTSSPVSSY